MSGLFFRENSGSDRKAISAVRMNARLEIMNAPFAIIDNHANRMECRNVRMTCALVRMISPAVRVDGSPIRVQCPDRIMHHSRDIMESCLAIMSSPPFRAMRPMARTESSPIRAEGPWRRTDVGCAIIDNLDERAKLKGSGITSRRITDRLPPWEGLTEVRFRSP